VGDGEYVWEAYVGGVRGRSMKEEYEGRVWMRSMKEEYEGGGGGRSMREGEFEGGVCWRSMRVDVYDEIWGWRSMKKVVGVWKRREGEEYWGEKRRKRALLKICFENSGKYSWRCI
jgi:hypothetical protein